MDKNEIIGSTKPRISYIFMQALSDNNMTTDDLIASNRIPAWLINAILNDNIEKLQKERSSSMGFLQKLEQILSLDKGKLLNAAFHVEVTPHSVETDTKEGKTEEKKEAKFNYADNLAPVIFWLLLILGVPALLFFGIYNKMALDKVHSSNNIGTYGQNGRPLDDNTILSPNASVSVKLEAIEAAWIKVYVDGVFTEEMTMESGEIRTYNGNSSIRIYTGNAPMLKVNYSGERWGKLYAGTKKVIIWELTKGSQEPNITFPAEATGNNNAPATVNNASQGM